ncbi:hypothetical protein [Glutamicibacter protophormiae]|uniref:hypothetical protein n=1 Tax=Glutamicibacter protophormiae TaxID=37930 RepID=UPI00195A8F2E|nr:hypothetical protein [Glutamicibacter protophormiae]QRQ79183.1 hypothetical protein JQN66_02700 [Glutamicibacter protophormiae]
MAITSVGYDGTVDEAQWASMVSKVGGYEYGIDKAGDFAVTQSAGTRMISIAAGLAWGRGVMDISDAAAVIQLDAVTTGARYDLVAIRRSWGPANGGPSELVIIKGTSAKAIPAGRLATPGITDDQPIALVRVQAGSASIPEIIDLRVWGRNGGQLYALHDMVRSYLTSLGTEVNINGALWQYVPASNDTAAWQKYGQRGDTGIVTVTTGFASGWGGSGAEIKYSVRDGLCQLYAKFYRTGGELEVPVNGNIPNVHVLTLPVPARPRMLSGGHSGASGVGLAAAIGTTGNVDLTWVSPNERILKGRDYSIAATYHV